MDYISTLLVIAAYIVLSYQAIKLVRKHSAHRGTYFRMLVHSFAYALFWGIGIAATGGDPGFALPMPNIVALVLMAGLKLYRGVLIGLGVLCIWWVIIFSWMLFNELLEKNRRRKSSLSLNETEGLNDLDQKKIH